MINALNITEARITLSRDWNFMKLRMLSGGKAVVNNAGTITKYFTISEVSENTVSKGTFHPIV